MTFPSSWRTTTLIVSALLCIQMATLYAYGKSPICACGHFVFWEGIRSPIGNSQALLDWYTFLHISQGVLSYVLLWYFFPDMPVASRFLVAVGVQFLWEIVENSPLMVSLYRLQVLSNSYSGDSLPNSFTDTLSVIIGFLWAWRLPILASIGLCILLDSIPLIIIHDDLVLGAVNFIHRFPTIEAWQMAAQQ